MGLLSKIGNGLNKLTGASNSAKTQFENQMALQKDAQAYSTWQMQNAHQTEVEDLKAAGLNPVLSAGAGGGASAGVTEGSASAGNASGNPLDMINTALSLKNTVAQADKTEAETDKIEEETGKTHEEKEILKIQKEYIAPMQESLIALNNANTGLAKQNTMKAFEETVKTQAEAFKAQVEAEMAGMDLNKRRKFYETETNLYQAQLKAGIVSMGFEGNTTYQAMDRAMGTVGKVFSGSVSYSYGHNTSHSTSNVNVHNTDYNPTRQAKIGF